MTIAIAGATGHLGRLVVDALLAQGIASTDIRAGGRRTDALAAYANRGVVVHGIDYNQPGTLDPLVAAADVLLLISGSEVGQRIRQHQAVIDAAQAAGVSRIVYTSSWHDVVVAPEHIATEEAITASGIPATFLRNGWYTENYLPALVQARATGQIVTSAGDGRVASASRRDFAEAAAVALLSDECAGRTYELSGDAAWSFDELAAAFTTLIGRPVTITNLSPEDHLQALLAAGLDEQTAGFLLAADANIRDGLMAITNGQLADLIGRPTTPLLQGLHALDAERSA